MDSFVMAPKSLNSNLNTKRFLGKGGSGELPFSFPVLFQLFFRCPAI